MADTAKPEPTTWLGRLWAGLWGAANREYEHPDLAGKAAQFLELAGKTLGPLGSAGALAIVFGSIRLTGDFREASAVLLEIDLARLIPLVILPGSFFVIPAIMMVIAVAVARSSANWSVGWNILRVVVSFGAIAALFVGVSCGVGSPVGFVLTIVALVLAAFFFASLRPRKSDTGDGLEVLLTVAACLATLAVVSWAWPEFLPREVLEIACLDDAKEEAAKACPETVRNVVVLDEGGDWFSYWDEKAKTVVHVAPDRVLSRN